MKFDSAALIEEMLWDMRVSEEPRAADRALILKTYNGNPPFDEATAEENHIQVNRSSLEGPNVLSQARKQWTNAFLKPSNFFSARPDEGPAHKQAKWSAIATKHANRLLKRERRMVGQIRAEGANTLLFGIGPSMWKDRCTVIPGAIPVGSLLIPSETEIDDFDNLQYFAVFREWNAAQLYDMTQGPRVDPGWNMDLVRVQMDYIRDELRKSPNSLAYQYMPERIEELIKQDKGYFGSDATPTVDVWDFYFREEENGKGWYRRILLDWGVGPDSSTTRPASRNQSGNDGKAGFLYSSGKRKYADSLEQILFCQFGDCSPYAPFKYHSVRGLGWMLWGVCDLQDRLHCKFNESVFEQLMWFFQTAGNQDLIRLKKANFEHMGIIPQGIRFLTPQERYTPNYDLINMAFGRNQKLVASSSTTYTQDYESTMNQSKGRTATETMAIVNSSQALASGILEQAYTYAVFKYREMFRRLCLKNSRDPAARQFRLSCLNDGVPEDMLDAQKWTIEPERVLGGGNKTIQMATIGFLNQIRANLPPDGQRMVDYLSVLYSTDQPGLADEIAPIGESKPISDSMLNAQHATQRIMAGLPYTLPKDAVHEDFVTVWLNDLALLVKKAMDRGGMSTPDELGGMSNMATQINGVLGIMAANPQLKDRVRQYQNLFGSLANHIKAFAQRLQQQMKAGAEAGNGAPQPDPKDAAKVQAMLIQAETKAKIAERSAASRTQQKEVQFQLAEKRKDQEAQSDLAREGAMTRHELMASRLKALTEAEE